MRKILFLLTLTTTISLAILAQTSKTLLLPTLPLELQSPNERVNFLIKNYWQNLDSSFIFNNSLHAEQAFVDFISLFPHCQSQEVLKQGIKALFKRVSYYGDHAVLLFFDLSEKYLYDLESPFRQDSIYCIFLQQILSHSNIKSDYLTLPKLHYQLLQRNSIGQKAENFLIKLKNNTYVKLSDISTNYTLLFFNDPSCDECIIVKNYLESSAFFSALSLVDLTIVSIYPNTNIELWKIITMPKSWINGYDSTMSITKNNLYDLRKLPSFYLLDQNKRIISKTYKLNEIELFLKSRFMK